MMKKSFSAAAFLELLATGATFAQSPARDSPYHHSMFELFALETTLDLTDAATRADIVKAMDGHIL